MTAEERAARGVAIRELLNDQNVKDAFVQIEADLIEEWKRADSHEAREDLWRAVNVMGRLMTNLNAGRATLKN